MTKFLSLVALFGITTLVSAQVPVVKYPSYMTSINYPMTYGIYQVFPPIEPVTFTTPYTLAPLKNPLANIHDEKAFWFQAVARRTAIVTVVMPTEEAALIVQGVFIPGNGFVRSFVSPDLEFGIDYIYIIDVSWKQDGKIYNTQKNIPVKAGGYASEVFDIYRSKKW